MKAKKISFLIFTISISAVSFDVFAEGLREHT